MNSLRLSAMRFCRVPFSAVFIVLSASSVLPSDLTANKPVKIVETMHIACDKPSLRCSNASVVVEKSEKVSFEEQLEAVGNEIWSIHWILSTCAKNPTPECEGFAHVIAQTVSEMKGLYRCVEAKSENQRHDLLDTEAGALKIELKKSSSDVRGAKSAGRQFIYVPARDVKVPGVNWDAKTKVVFINPLAGSSNSPIPPFNICFELPESSKKLLDRLEE